MRHLFPQPVGVSEEILMDYYGRAAPLNPNNPAINVSLDNLRACLAAAPPLSSPHKDGWRVEHLTSLVVDPACGEALTSLMTTLAKGDVFDKIAILVSYATLVILLKKDAETMAHVKLLQGKAYLQPQMPLCMGSTLVKVASNCALLIKGSLDLAIGPT